LWNLYQILDKKDMSDQISLVDKICSYFEPGHIGKSIEVGTYHNYLTFGLEEKFWKSYSVISEVLTYSEVRKGRRLVLNLDCSLKQQNIDYILKYSNITPLDVLIIDDQEKQFDILKGINLSQNAPRLIGIKNLKQDLGITEYLKNYGMEFDFNLEGVHFFNRSEKKIDLETIFSINY
jgi:hypothetical protein